VVNFYVIFQVVFDISLPTYRMVGLGFDTLLEWHSSSKEDRGEVLHKNILSIPQFYMV